MAKIALYRCWRLQYWTLLRGAGAGKTVEDCSSIIRGGLCFFSTNVFLIMNTGTPVAKNLCMSGLPVEGEALYVSPLRPTVATLTMKFSNTMVPFRMTLLENNWTNIVMGWWLSSSIGQNPAFSCQHNNLWWNVVMDDWDLDEKSLG